MDKTHIINKNNYLFTRGVLNYQQRNLINKRISLYKIKNINKKDIDYTIDKGDIIRYKNNLYYIYDLNNLNLVTYRIKDKVIDYRNMFLIPYKGRYKYYDTLSKNEKNQVDKNILIERSKKGAIIKQNNNLYYVLEEYKECFDTVLIYFEKISGYNKLKANNKKYYTKFNKVIIKKNVFFEIINKANIQEIDSNYTLLSNMINKKKRKKTR